MSFSRRDEFSDSQRNGGCNEFTWPVALFVLACLALLITKVATRDSLVGTDTQNYIYVLEGARNCGCSPDGFEPIFAVLALAFGAVGAPDAFFFGLISAIQLIAAVKLGWSLANLLKYEEKNPAFVLLFLALLVVFPFFVAMQINVIRQGAGAFFVALSAIQVYRRRYWSSIALIAIGAGFHYSTLMYASAIPLLLLKPSTRKAVFVVALLMYLTGTSEYAIRLISDASGLPVYSMVAGYGATADYKDGIRYDFVAFSLLPLGLTYLTYLSFPSSDAFDRMTTLSSIYTVLLIPFLILGWGHYSDRYALGAWLLMPAFGALLMSRLIRGRQLILPLSLVFIGVVFFFLNIDSMLS